MSAQQPQQVSGARPREARTTAARAVQRAAAGGKLTPADVRTIRARCAAGEADEDVAVDYGVTPRMIGYVRTRKRWASVT